MFGVEAFRFLSGGGRGITKLQGKSHKVEIFRLVFEDKSYFLHIGWSQILIRLLIAIKVMKIQKIMSYSYPPAIWLKKLE